MSSRIGQKFTTNQGYTIEIIGKIATKFYTISFENGITLNRFFQAIKSGSIKNPNHKSVYGVGYFGIGEYKTSINRKATKNYVVWKDMLRRCYDYKHPEKDPTYKECLVSEEWHNFQIFSQWFDNNYIEGFALDKDILQKGNKIYSKENCCFVPTEINSLLLKKNLNRGVLPIGVHKSGVKFHSRLSKKNIREHIGLYETKEQAFEAYKIEKEKYIKQVAEKYKSQITEQVYQALMNYQVDIND